VPNEPAVEAVGPMQRSSRDTTTVPTITAAATIADADDGAERALAGSRPAYFAAAGEGLVDVPVYQRERLRAGDRLAGPAIVEQYDSTTVVCPGQAAAVDRFGNLVVTTPARPAGGRCRP